MLDSRNHFYPHINQYKIHLFQNFESGLTFESSFLLLKKAAEFVFSKSLRHLIIKAYFKAFCSKFRKCIIQDKDKIEKLH
jgi:hypothetical protein